MIQADRDGMLVCIFLLLLIHSCRSEGQETTENQMPAASKQVIPIIKSIPPRPIQIPVIIQPYPPRQKQTDKPVIQPISGVKCI